MLTKSSRFIHSNVIIHTLYFLTPGHTGEDFGLLSEKTLIFEAGERSKTVSLVVYDDQMEEELKEFTVSVHPSGKWILRSHAHFFIKDNDSKSGITI